jgi:hypothetical protein
VNSEDPVVKLDAALLKTPAPAGAVTAPLAINGESQLFVDDHLIAFRTAAHRRLNRPAKDRAPFLVPDRVWEGQAAVYGSVVEHDGGLRLYYKGWQNNTPLNYAQFRAKHGYGKYPVCAAHSRDGLAFSKDPLADAVHPGTNIAIDDQIDDFTVLKDSAEPDANRRFKLLASKGNWWAGLTPATSPDGIRWTWGRENAVAYFGDRCSYWYDPIQKKHVAWSRNYPLIGGRVLVHKETADFDNWSDERLSPVKLVMQPDRDDHEQTQFYGGYAFWYRSLYLAYVEVYYIHQQRLDTQLACSRDGRTWTRLCDREPFLTNGEHGEFDAYWSVPTFNAPVLRNGSLLIHYNGRPDPHSQPGFPFVPPGAGGSFALARLREDGFVSLDSTGGEGIVETKPLKLPDGWKTLDVNVCPFNTRPGYEPMRVTVELLDEGGTAVAAYAIRPGADPAQVWYKIARTEGLPETVRLRFRLFNSRLYAFRFAL